MDYYAVVLDKYIAEIILEVDFERQSVIGVGIESLFLSTNWLTLYCTSPA